MIFNPIVPKMEQPTYISSLAVGSSVWCNVNGTRTEFIVVNQGIPSNSTLYDNSCDGTWLLMKDVYGLQYWGNSAAGNNYKNSSIHAYLNSTFFGMFDTSVQNVIKQSKIPYFSDSLQSGADGLLCKIFLLSCYELGWTQSDDGYFPIDGAKLDYFMNGTTASANNKRKAYYNGSGVIWWQRSRYLGDSMAVWTVVGTGAPSTATPYGSSDGVRPAFILPFDTKIDKDNNIIAPPPVSRKSSNIIGMNRRI